MLFGSWSWTLGPRPFGNIYFGKHAFCFSLRERFQLCNYCITRRDILREPEDGISRNLTNEAIAAILWSNLKIACTILHFSKLKKKKNWQRGRKVNQDQWHLYLEYLGVDSMHSQPWRHFLGGKRRFKLNLRPSIHIYPIDLKFNTLSKHSPWCYVKRRCNVWANHVLPVTSKVKSKKAKIRRF